MAQVQNSHEINDVTPVAQKGNSIETFVWISIEVFSIPLFFSDNNELKKIEPAQTSVMLEGENVLGGR